jgi:hypothetical protein
VKAAIADGQPAISINTEKLISRRYDIQNHLTKIVKTTRVVLGRWVCDGEQQPRRLHYNEEATNG